MTALDDAARKGALVVPAAERGTILVTGPDRVTWLNGVVTCDVGAVKPGHGALGLVLTKTGKILSDLWVVATDDALCLSLASGRVAELHPYLERMLVMEDAEIEEQSAAWTWLTLHGPRALELGLAEARAAGGGAGTLQLRGPDAVALVVPRAGLDHALSSLVARGPDVAVADAEAWHRFRVEHGIGVYGQDFGADDNPHEAGLDQLAVSWTKGCYLGQEVVCMQGMRGKLKRRLVSLRLESGVAPAAGAAVCSSDGSSLGEVTSAATVDAGAFALARVSGSGIDAKVPLFVAGVPASIVERTEAA